MGFERLASSVQSLTDTVMIGYGLGQGCYLLLPWGANGGERSSFLAFALLLFFPQVESSIRTLVLLISKGGGPHMLDPRVAEDCGLTGPPRTCHLSKMPRHPE